MPKELENLNEYKRLSIRLMKLFCIGFMVRSSGIPVYIIVNK